MSADGNQCIQTREKTLVIFSGLTVWCYKQHIPLDNIHIVNYYIIDLIIIIITATNCQILTAQSQNPKKKYDDIRLYRNVQRHQEQMPSRCLHEHNAEVKLVKNIAITILEFK